MMRYEQWFLVTEKPEDIFYMPELETYHLKLKTGGTVKAERINGYWFGLWRWIPDSEVKEWTYMI